MASQSSITKFVTRSLQGKVLAPLPESSADPHCFKCACGLYFKTKQGLVSHERHVHQKPSGPSGAASSSGPAAIAGLLTAVKEDQRCACGVGQKGIGQGFDQIFKLGDLGLEL